MKRHTQDELADLAIEKGGVVEFDNDDNIAVLMVNGRETGDYAALSAFGKGAAS